MSEFIQLLFDGLVSGAVLAIAAVGISTVYASLRIVNFAHGDFLTFGAYIGFAVNGLAHLSLGVAMLAAIAATALLGCALEVVLWRPLRRRGAGVLSMFVSSIGLALILRQSLLFVAGGSLRSYTIDVFRTYSLGSLRISEGQLLTIAISFAVIGVLALALARTGFGRSVRALADDAQLADIAGVNTKAVIMVTWALAGGLAGLAGVLEGLVQTSFDTNLGWNLLLFVFSAVVLGGIGSTYGALIGGLVIGVAMNISSWSGFAGGLNASYEPVVAFGLLIVILLVRPQGLLGKSRLL